MIELPLQIGPNPPGFGSLLTSLWSKSKGPKGQPPGTVWLTYGQIDSQVARQVKAQIEAQCFTAPMATLTTASQKSLADMDAYLDVLSDPNTVTAVVNDAIHNLQQAGQLKPLAACGGSSPILTTPTPTPTATPAGTTPGAAAAAGLASPANLILYGGGALALLLLMRRK